MYGSWRVLDDRNAARSVVAQARVGGRDKVGIIVLGRGEDGQRVQDWVAIGAQTAGFIGFAVGRTVFWQPLVDYKDGSISRADAVSRIARTYQLMYRVFVGARSATQA
jgi:5-dehydro-2-deoxygluconokinase